MGEREEKRGNGERVRSEIEEAGKGEGACNQDLNFNTLLL